MNNNYHFHEIYECNFCKNKTAKNKILGIRLNKSQGFNPKSKTGIAVSIVKCNRCNLIYSSPQPRPFNIQDHYGIPPESYWNDNYFNIDENYFKSEINSVKTLIDFQEGMKALDVGAGIGKGMIALNQNGFDAYGLEPSITFREKAIEKMNINPDRIKLGMLEELEYPTEYFDFITFGAVLEHLYDPALAIEQTLSWLKPDGVIQIEVPSSKWLIARIFNRYFKLKRTNFVTNLSPMHEPFHMFEFDLKSFKELGKRVNFDIVQHKFHVCEIYHIPKFFHPIFKWYMKKTNTGMQLTVYLRKNR